MSLHAGADASAVTKMLRKETVGGIVHQEQCVSGFSDSFGLILPRFKQRFTFLHQDTGKLPSPIVLQSCELKYFSFILFVLMSYSHGCSYSADLHSLLDMAKIADSLLFVLDTTEGWDSYGDYCLSCLFAQGLPSHGGYNFACACASLL